MFLSNFCILDFHLYKIDISASGKYIIDIRYAQPLR